MVKDALKTSLDEQVAAALLDGKEPTPALRDLLAWGPPEEQVRALTGAARGPDAARADRALDRLVEWAREWNRAGNLPATPARGDDPEAYLEAWDAWYMQMKHFPLNMEEDDDAEEAKEEVEDPDASTPLTLR